MSDPLTDRLNQILPIVTSDDFLQGKGLGNEIAFYIFDYPPEAELRIREHIAFLLYHMPRQRPDLRVVHINLLDFIIEHLRQRKLLDKAVEMQKTKGDAFVLKQLSTLLHANKIAPAFTEVAQPDQHDLVLVSGVGSAYPMLRAHSLLNNLHAVMGRTPLVLFYPGRYDGQALRLFGKLQNNNYYRAFKLVP
jgi:hypothetical protein